MQGRRVLRSMTLRNVLSFRDEQRLTDFEPLNVLIGANGSGKSNLIECLELVRWLPKDLQKPIRAGGSMRVWFGRELVSDPSGKPFPPFFEIHSGWDLESDLYVHHHIILSSEDGRAVVLAENANLIDVATRRPQGLYHYSDKVFHISDLRTIAPPEGTKSQIQRKFQRNQSVLAQRRDTDKYPALAAFGDLLSEIRIYRDWTVASTSRVRDLQPAELTDEYLLEDFSNLYHVLARLFSEASADRPELLELLRRVYEGVEDVRVTTLGEYLQLSLIEEGGYETTARRMSDGTLRFLALVAILGSPTPPPLICIEEPELGLHPDAIPVLTEMLRDAAERTQLIVTTHSADLISGLSDVPEAVITCEREYGQTVMKRLDPDRLKLWLERYTLGDLWLSGEIGGTRW